MFDVTKIRSARFQEYLKRLFNLEGGAAREISAFAPVWNATGAEHYRARGEHQWWGGVQRTPAVGQFTVLEVGIVAPGALTVVEELLVELSVAGNIFIGLEAPVPFAIDGGVAAFLTDGRAIAPQAPNVAPKAMTLLGNLSVAVAFAPSTPFLSFNIGANLPTPIPLELVLVPGLRLDVSSDTANTNIKLAARGYERTIEPSEAA